MTTEETCDYSHFSVLLCSWTSDWVAAVPDILSWFEILTVDGLLYSQPYLLWGMHTKVGVQAQKMNSASATSTPINKQWRLLQFKLRQSC